jgi:hypothetical protein
MEESGGEYRKEGKVTLFSGGERSSGFGHGHVIHGGKRDDLQGKNGNGRGPAANGQKWNICIL